MSRPGPWRRVVCAAELPPCPDCEEEPWCPKHKKHFADCTCIGPTEDDVEYRERKGVLEGRRLTRKPKEG